MPVRSGGVTLQKIGKVFWGKGWGGELVTVGWGLSTSESWAEDPSTHLCRWQQTQRGKRPHSVEWAFMGAPAKCQLRPPLRRPLRIKPSRA